MGNIMCEERIKELEEEIESLEGDIEWRDDHTKNIERLLESAKRQASIPRKKLRARGVRTSDTSVESLQGQLTGSQRQSSRLKREKAALEEELEELKNQGCC